MPLPAESLTPDSSDEQVKQAISDSIAQCMHEGGRELEQCVAMAYAMMRRATGKGAGGGGRNRIRAGLER